MLGGEVDALGLRDSAEGKGGRGRRKRAEKEERKETPLREKLHKSWGGLVSPPPSPISSKVSPANYLLRMLYAVLPARLPLPSSEHDG
jgi:hypothetical protein